MTDIKRTTSNPEDRYQRLSDLMKVPHKVAYRAQWGNVRVYVNSRERRIDLSCPNVNSPKLTPGHA